MSPISVARLRKVIQSKNKRFYIELLWVVCVVWLSTVITLQHCLYDW